MARLAALLSDLPHGVAEPRYIIGRMTTLESKLAAHFCESGPHVVSAYLFGSRARDAERRESDVDVAVLFDREELPGRDERARAAVRLNSELVAVTHCNNVDVVVLNDATPELVEQALAANRSLRRSAKFRGSRTSWSRRWSLFPVFGTS